MPTTSATLLFKTSWATGTAATRSTTASMVIPFRMVSGQYGTSLKTNAQQKKNWKPSALAPLTDSNGLITGEWMRFFSDLANRKLGGPSFPTLPDLTDFITKSQVDNIVSSAISQALEQQVQANAQSLAALVQVAQPLAGSAQIPPVVLVRQDVTSPTQADIGDTGGGGGD